MNITNFLLEKERIVSNFSQKEKFKQRTLILNSDFTPLSIVTTYRSLSLFIKDRIDSIHHHENEYINGVNTSFASISVGRIKRRYVKMDSYYVPYARKLVLKRDGHKCVYCGSSSNLTIDHVVPISKGGKSSWENTVTSCWKCNNSKGETNVKDFMETKNFTHMIKPFKPHQILMMINGNINDIPEIWKQYLFLKK